MRKIAVPAALIVLGVAALLVLSITAGGIPEIQARELAGGAFDGREIKVHGLLHAIQSHDRPLRFQVRDKKDPSHVFDVVADETRPDTFQVSYDVAVQGRWDSAEGRFHADKVFTKCPSKYEAAGKSGVGSAQGAYGSESGSPAKDGVRTAEDPAPR